MPNKSFLFFFNFLLVPGLPLWPSPCSMNPLLSVTILFYLIGPRQIETGGEDGDSNRETPSVLALPFVKLPPLQEESRDTVMCIFKQIYCYLAPHLVILHNWF